MRETVNGERCDVLDVSLHEPLEAVTDADDVHAFEPGADGGGRDDAVDARGGTAADQYRQSLMVFHCNRFYRRFLSV